MKQKSELNYHAANLLIDETYFAASVHCSYYSCFQLFKYTVKQILGINYDELDLKIGLSKQNSHQYIIQSVTDKIRDDYGSRQSRDMNNEIMDLKQFRTQSDYDDIEIDIEKSRKAFAKAGEIRKYLNQKYKL
ncbi:MAG: hypothetical protein K9I68_07980 [Bacteroidales bacterium]|nr:hypothetical protein [Bacteroidales bacterium]MCF8338388.1 hypothetical protein [Bacteroidales bacterium]